MPPFRDKKNESFHVGTTVFSPYHLKYDNKRVFVGCSEWNKLVRYFYWKCVNSLWPSCPSFCCSGWSYTSMLLWEHLFMCDDKCVMLVWWERCDGNGLIKSADFKYDGKRVPVGWGEWNGLLRNSRFYNYSLNVNGKIFNSFRGEAYLSVNFNCTLVYDLYVRQTFFVLYCNFLNYRRNSPPWVWLPVRLSARHHYKQVTILFLIY